MKKIAILFLVAAGFLSPSAEAAVFPDVPDTHWAAKEIEYLSSRGIIKGGSNGMYNKDAPVTKAQAAAVLVRANNLPLTNVPNPGFSDVPVSHRFYKEIAAAVHAGWFSKSKNFQPDSHLKRVEMAKSTQLAFHIKGTLPVEWKDMSASDVNNAYVTPLLASGITSGYTATMFNPSLRVTRAQFAVFMARALDTKFRLPVIAYPRRAAEDIYYPQFVDTAGKTDFTFLNAFYQEKGQELVVEGEEKKKRPGGSYGYIIDYTIPRMDKEYVSVLFEEYSFADGAPGYPQLFSYNHDMNTRTLLSVHDLALRPGYEKAVLERLNRPSGYRYSYRGNVSSLDEVAYQFYLKPDQFIMYLHPSQYVPYAKDTLEFSMPYSMIR